MKSSAGYFCILLLSLSLLLPALQACRIDKFIPKHKRLLAKVKIEKVKGAPGIDRENLYPLLKQRENRKVLGVRIYMWNYLRNNKPKQVEKRSRKVAKLKEQVVRLRTEEQSLASDDQKHRIKIERKINRLTNRIDTRENTQENLRRSVWEEPAILDSTLLDASANQIKSYLFNKGYFHDSVGYVIRSKYFIAIRNRKNHKAWFHLFKRSKQANVYFSVKAGPEYKIDRIDYSVGDSVLGVIVRNDLPHSLLNPGMRYDGDILTQERDRLTLLFRNQGYFDFSREYIYFDLDTALSGHIVNVGLVISNPPGRLHHRRYIIRNIIAEPEYILGENELKDTIRYGEITFISKKMKVRPDILADFIFFKRDSLYRASDYQSTMNRLSRLGIYKFIDIEPIRADTTDRDTGYIDVNMRFTPLISQEYGVNLDLNSTEESQAQISSTRFFGTSASFVYRHKNLAQRALQLEIQPRAAVEVPITIFQNSHVIDTPNYQYGITTSLIFPQLLFIPRVWTDKALRLGSRTAWNLTFLNEENKFFKRTTLNLNLTWQINSGRLRQYISPLDISLVNTDFRSVAYQSRILGTHDPLIINLFDRHLLTGFRYSIFVNQQPFTNVSKRFFTSQTTVEIGGNLPFLVDLAGIWLRHETITTDQTLTRSIGSIRYYQYARLEQDVRYYIPVWRESNLAFRGIAGLGAPYNYSDILPFEKRFTVGGANSIRAWRLRELGPGSYKDKSGIHFESGDMKLEVNSELRVPVYGMFKGALFVDAGNVWTYSYDSARPGTQFRPKQFYKEIAVGGGFGTRFDFSFFVLRLDFGWPMRDPADGWVLRRYLRLKEFVQSPVINLGIGYPF